MTLMGWRVVKTELIIIIIIIRNYYQSNRAPIKKKSFYMNKYIVNMTLLIKI